MGMLAAVAAAWRASRVTFGYICLHLLELPLHRDIATELQRHSEHHDWLGQAGLAISLFVRVCSTLFSVPHAGLRQTSGPFKANRSGCNWPCVGVPVGFSDVQCNLTLYSFIKIVLI